MKRRAGLAQAGQRWLLAALCLLASFAFLGRATGPGGIGAPPAPLWGAWLVGNRAPEAGPTHRPALRHSQLGHSQPGHPAHTADPQPVQTHTAGPAVAARLPLTQAAPNAPPHGPTHSPDSHRTGHGAHCPFCFTAAFALEAEGALVLAQAAAARLAPADRWAGPWLAPVRHVQARAPPFSPVDRKPSPAPRSGGRRTVLLRAGDRPQPSPEVLPC